MMTTNDENPTNWKSQIYIMGAALGLAFGAIAAYLFARAAEEDVEKNNGKPQKIKTKQILTLSMSALSFVRQITELGKTKK